MKPPAPLCGSFETPEQAIHAWETGFKGPRAARIGMPDPVDTVVSAMLRKNQADRLQARMGAVTVAGSKARRPAG